MDISKYVDDLQQEFTAADIARICNIHITTFYRHQEKGEVPFADDEKRSPHTYYRANVLSYIEKQLIKYEEKLARKRQKENPASE